MKSERSSFWISKIERNMERDCENEQALKCLGWSVIRFWGKDIIKNTDECVKSIEELIFDLRMVDFLTQEKGRNKYMAEYKDEKICYLIELMNSYNNTVSLRDSVISNNS